MADELNLATLYQLKYNLISFSQPMREVCHEISQIAVLDVNVLLLGERGVGKDLVARVISGESKRRGHFAYINCTTIPDELLESELFGHVKGAYTGAITTRKGKFEYAQGGTIFLNEIGDMGHNLQAKLLRAVEDKVMTKVGQDEETKIDARIIAATNKDLHKAMGEGTFREDLYDRLAVAVIKIPPLRDRREDIPPLIMYFLERYQNKHEKDVEPFTTKEIMTYMNYEWPGNVRQLRNAVERVVVKRRDKVAVLEEITKEVGNVDRRNGFSTDSASIYGADGGIMRLDDLARRHALAVLEHFGGDYTRTARALGIYPKTLYRKLREYGVK